MKPAYAVLCRAAVLAGASLLSVAPSLFAAEGTAAVPAAAAVDQAKSAKSEVLDRATALVKAGDFAAALAAVEELRKQLPNSDPGPDELRGTILALKKDYQGAEASFRLMLKNAPQSHIGRFNLAEVIFLQTRFAEAEKAFAALEAERGKADPDFAELCRFKRMVCWVGAGNLREAEGMLASGPAPEGAGAAYARAAIQFSRGDLETAAKTLAAARAKFGARVELLFADSFVELKWGARDDKTGAFGFLAGKK